MNKTKSKTNNPNRLLSLISNYRIYIISTVIVTILFLICLKLADSYPFGPLLPMKGDGMNQIYAKHVENIKEIKAHGLPYYNTFSSAGFTNMFAYRIYDITNPWLLLKYYLISDSMNPQITAATQWFERTLDDSANKRVSIPEAFLACDAVLTLYRNVISGLTVYPKIVEKHLNDELPFMSTENILMYCVENKGASRQDLHEAIREHSVAAAKRMKETGEANDLMDRIRNDVRFGLSEEELASCTDAKQFTGIAQYQAENFIKTYVRPMLEKNKELLDDETPEINV